MKVILLSYTPDPEKIAAVAARVCYSSSGAAEIMSTIKEEKIRKRIKDCVEMGHHSVLEHASFTFSIEGISRVTSHQLVRHRIASFSQQSQRYVKMGETVDYIIPPRINEDQKMRQRFEEIIVMTKDFYNDIVKDGVPCEDARYVLPSAFATNLVVTMNARELLHFFSIRCCKKAQWEIRKLAYNMLRLVIKAAPMIFENAGPSCFEGDCPQGDRKCFERMGKFREKERDLKGG